MTYFWITLAVMIIVILAMAVGVIFSNRELKGSCGGLGRVMGDSCMFCGKKEDCRKDKELKTECQGQEEDDDEELA